MDGVLRLVLQSVAFSVTNIAFSLTNMTKVLRLVLQTRKKGVAERGAAGFGFSDVLNATPERGHQEVHDREELQSQIRRQLDILRRD